MLNFKKIKNYCLYYLHMINPLHYFAHWAFDDKCNGKCKKKYNIK